MAVKPGTAPSGAYVIETSQGTIEVQLYPAAAPKTVTNFVNLASAGFFDRLVWHRIVQGFVIQTGDPNTRNGAGDRNTWGMGGSPVTVPLEIDGGVRNEAGSLGMARTADPNSGSSQFFINLTNNSPLDGQYTVFGRVVGGMDAVQKLAAVQVDGADRPVDPRLAMMTRVKVRSPP